MSPRIAPYICVVACVLAACSNTKNTASTRAFHNVTSRYNVVFEARESYIAGLKAISTNSKTDYTDMLPVYRIDAPDAAQVAVSYMDACVEECGKNILKHSITAKPQRKYSHSGMSEADQAFYNKPEYCKWIDDTYLLMGKANYVAGDLDRAESSLRICVTRFRHEQSKFEAQLWLAKTFWAQKNYLESTELLDKLVKDLRHPKKLDVDIKKVYAQNAISNRNYEKAIEYLNEALLLTKKKQDKAWLQYILGDLNRLAGHYTEAHKCYEAVVKSKTEYSMVFNAKINLAVVFTPGDNVEKIKAELTKLANDPKNAPYRDQIYYALAELDYKNNNITSALINYRLSAQYSSNNNIQKAKSYMAAADIYFAKNDYINAGIFYDSTMSYLPKTYSDYATVSTRAANLSELIRHIRAAEHQDSLQKVAQMSESERKKLISKIIADVVNKEEAEKLMQSQPYYSSNDNNYGVEYIGQDGNPGFSGKWYLYNVTALNYGRTEFLKKWGVRPLEDNWRRKNKTTSDIVDNETDNEEESNTDSTLNNKMPEYYTRNLPLSDSAMTACINKEADAWFAAAGVYQEKLNDPDKAIETLLYINTNHPNHYLMPQSLYLLVKLYGIKGEFQLADYNKRQLIAQYPNTGYAKILDDPNYIDNVANRKKEALDFYDNILSDFSNKKYTECLNLCKEGQQKYTDLELMENFIYMEARCLGNLRDIPNMKSRLEYLVETYPNSKLVEPSRRKLEAIASGNFETHLFSTAPNEKHTIVVSVTEDSKNAAQLKFYITKFCADNGFRQTEITEMPIATGKLKVYAISPIDGQEEAMKFTKQFTEQYNIILVPSSDYKIMAVADHNMKHINNEQTLQSYYNFYIENY